MASDPKMVDLVLGKMGAPSGAAPASDEGELSGDGEVTAAEEAMSAIKSGDAAGLAAALKSFFQMVDGADVEEG